MRQKVVELDRIFFATLLTLAASFPILASNSLAGEIKGKVVVQAQSRSGSEIVSREIIRRYINKAYPRETHRDEQPAIVVYIDGFKFGHANGSRPTAVLDQVNETFVPHVLPILVGTTVRFLNSDDVYHNVFSFSPAKSFDLGRYKRGKSRSVTFDKPGVVKVYCDIHSHMNAFILVLENPFFAVTDEHGVFEIKNVPRGNYVLKAWHGRWPEKSATITVKKNGSTTVNFEFP